MCQARDGEHKVAWDETVLIQGRRQEMQSTGCKPQGKGFKNPTKFNCGLGGDQ